MRNNILILAVVVFSFALSCTGDNVSNNNDITSNQTLDAWMKANKPNIEKYKEGLYVKITRNPNSIPSSESPVDSSVVCISYNVQDLEGNFAANTDAQTARILGTYSNKANYVPFPFILGAYNSYNGISPAIYDVLKTMKKGDKAEIYAAPEWAYSNTGLDSVYLGFKGNKPIGKSKIVNINLSLDSIQSNPKVSQRKLLFDYATKNFSKTYTTVRTGIYKDVLVNITNPKDTIASDTTLMIDYIGYLPNGFVFDTSLKSVAEEHRIYNSSSKYEPLTFEYNRKDTTSFDGKVKAWKYVINTMKVGEQAIFISDAEFCYGNGGKYDQDATLLPAYTPLVFFIHVLTPDEASAREEETE